MDAGEALDREVIVERAEALRGWLSTLSLSSRATGALNRELDGIIANDPGGYINGQRPLAGLTIADFITELHRPSAGVVGRVKSVGNSALTELRAAIPPEATTPAAQPGPQASTEPPAAEDQAATPSADADGPQAAQATSQDEAPPRRGRGRPRGSTRAAPERTETPEPQAAEVAAPEQPAPRRRGRPRKSEAPAPTAIAADAPAPNGKPPAVGRAGAPLRAAPADQTSVPAAPPRQPDPALEQILRLWPSLHPAARRAIVLYASSLLAEGSYEV